MLAHAIAQQIQQRETTAQAVTEAALARIAQHDQTFNCFTQVLSDAALDAAAIVDQKLANGEPTGPLAGVPFAV